jgi:hypothetical protein
MVAGFVVLLAGVFGIRWINAHWPYRYRNVEPLLQKLFASQVKIDHYHRIYFPHPGFVATGVTLRRNSAPDLPPIGTLRGLVVQGEWGDLLLLRDRVRLVDVEGLDVVIPPVGSRENHEDFPPGSAADFSGPTTVVEKFNLHDSKLDIMRTDGGRYSFPIRQLLIRNLRMGQAISYFVDMQNAKPTGRIVATGSFGPLLAKNLGATPVSGNYTFAPVNLGDIGGISGGMSAKGHFSGTLTAIETEAVSDTPDFAVGRGKPTHLAASVRATVNGLNADIVLHGLDVQIDRSTVHASGSVAGSPKTTHLAISTLNGRVEDVLRPFFHDQVPVTGAVWLRSQAYIAPSDGRSRFLQRLQMDGVFDIPAERVTDRVKEQRLSAFSERAQGKENTFASGGDATVPEVLSSLNGRAKIRNGVVSTDGLICQMPGATVNVGGTFNLYDGTVQMAGNLRMQSDISHVTTGFKSVLLKPLSPFFKKDNAGAVIPIAITGSPKHYQITQNLLHHK